MFTYASVPAPRKVCESEAWRRSPIDINLREMQYLNRRYVYPCPQAPASVSMLHAKKGAFLRATVKSLEESGDENTLCLRTQLLRRHEKMRIRGLV